MATVPPYANLVGLYPAQSVSQMQSLPTPGTGEAYLVLKVGGGYSEAGIHAGIQFVSPLLVALARSQMSLAKSTALAGLCAQVAQDVGDKAPIGAYAALLPGIMALASAS